MAPCFDGSFIHQEGKAEVVLYAPDGIDISFSFKFKFHYSNIEPEYEALNIGLISTLQMGIRRFHVQDYSGSLSNKSMESSRLKESLFYLIELLSRSSLDL